MADTSLNNNDRKVPTLVGRGTLPENKSGPNDNQLSRPLPTHTPDTTGNPGAEEAFVELYESIAKIARGDNEELLDLFCAKASEDTLKQLLLEAIDRREYVIAKCLLSHSQIDIESLRTSNPEAIDKIDKFINKEIYYNIRRKIEDSDQLDQLKTSLDDITSKRLTEICLVAIRYQDSSVLEFLISKITDFQTLKCLEATINNYPTDTTDITRELETKTRLRLLSQVIKKKLAELSDNLSSTEESSVEPFALDLPDPSISEEAKVGDALLYFTQPSVPDEEIIETGVAILAELEEEHQKPNPSTEDTTTNPNVYVEDTIMQKIVALRELLRNHGYTPEEETISMKEKATTTLYAVQEGLAKLKHTVLGLVKFSIDHFLK